MFFFLIKLFLGGYTTSSYYKQVFCNQDKYAILYPNLIVVKINGHVVGNLLLKIGIIQTIKKKLKTCSFRINTFVVSSTVENGI